MSRTALLLACVAYGVRGRRVQSSHEKPQSGHLERSQEAFTKLLLASETSAAFNPFSPGVRLQVGDSRSADSRVLHEQVNSRHSVPAMIAWDEDPWAEDMEIQEDKKFVNLRENFANIMKQRKMVKKDYDSMPLLPTKEKPLHSKVIALMDKLAGMKGMKRGGRKMVPFDGQALARIVRKGGGLNNQTLFTVLKDLKTKGNWQLSIALLQTVEMNVKGPKSEETEERQTGEKWAAYRAEDPEDDEEMAKIFFESQVEDDELEDDEDEEEFEDEEAFEFEEEFEDDDELLEEDGYEGIDEGEEEEECGSPPRQKMHTVGKTTVTFFQPTDTCHYNIVLATCAEKGRWEEALVLLKRMHKREVPRDLRTYHLVMSVLEKTGRTKIAVKIWQELFEDTDLDPNADTYAGAIAAAMQARDLPRAKFFIHLAFDQEVELTKNFYAKALSTCKQDGDWSRALMLLRKLDVDGVKPSVAMLNSIMAAFAADGQAPACDKFMREEFKRRGLKPDSISYNTLLSAFAHAKPSPDVAGLREVMQEMEDFAAAGQTQLRPNTFSYNHLIYALGQSGQSLEAISKVLMEEMPSHDIPADVVTYRSVLNACNETGEWQAGLRVIARADNVGVELGTFGYSKVIDAAARAGKWEEACRLLDTISERGWSHNPRVVNLALSSCLVANSTDAATAGIASLDKVLSATAKAAEIALRPRAKIGIPSPPVNFDTMLYSQKLLQTMGAKMAEVVDLKEKVMKAMKPGKRPKFEPIRIKKDWKKYPRQRFGEQSEPVWAGRALQGEERDIGFDEDAFADAALAAFNPALPS